jgi:hypothetical protein
MVGRSRPFGFALHSSESQARDSNKTPQPPGSNACPLGTTRIWAITRSLAATRVISVDFFYLRLLRCFTSARFALCTYELSAEFHDINHGGLPHSDISGSMLACSSPKLIAACHVLHRRTKPRHPPSALSSLTTESLFSARHIQLSKNRPQGPVSIPDTR